jgi:sulfite reductase alpha subunit-like flavoprotein
MSTSSRESITITRCCRQLSNAIVSTTYWLMQQLFGAFKGLLFYRKLFSLILQIGDDLHVWTTNGTLNLPLHSPIPPMILIGPGTGVAPLRSYLHYLNFLQQQQSHEGHAPENVLFYGCRNRTSDYYFEDEYPALPVTLFTAFSRDNPNNVVYVQHVIAENMHILWPLINEHHAMIVVCGSSKQMPKDVRDSLVKCAIDVGGYTLDDAGKYYEQLMKCGRYQMETWS